jgi:hypothetical protein
MCRNRSVDDLKACARALIRHSLAAKAVEADVEVDVRACLAADGHPDLESEPTDIPYPGATKKQV